MAVHPSRVQHRQPMVVPLNTEQHTYGPRCRLAPVPQPRLESWFDGMPPTNAQFFYMSPISIDDPLSLTTADTRATKPPLRPFSQGDSNALETAWLGLSRDEDRKAHAAARRNRSPSPSVARANEKNLAAIVSVLSAQHRQKHAQEGVPAYDAVTTVRATLQGASTTISVCCEDLPADAARELSAIFCPLARRRQVALSVDKVVQAVMIAMGSRHTNSTVSEDPSALAMAPRSVSSSVVSRPGRPSPRRFDPLSSPAPSPRTDRSRPLAGSPQNGVDSQPEDDSDLSRERHLSSASDNLLPDLTATATAAIPVPVRPPALDDGISRKPFLRVDTPDTLQSRSPVSSLPKKDSSGIRTPTRDKTPSAVPPAETPPAAPAAQMAEVAVPGKAAEVGGALAAEQPEQPSVLLNALKVSASVPVGVSRLHMVDLPALQMNPIYWSPVNDIAIVQRATWFYRDTMLPLEPTVANQLESFYRELRPWTETWADELRCAIDVGPLGEEKVSQPLWPKPLQCRSKAKAGVYPEPIVSSDSFCAARCHWGAAASEGLLEPLAGDKSSGVATSSATSAVTTADGTAGAVRSFANYHVVYKDGTAAFLLKPSLKPSAYYSRRPIAKICKGATIGIPIVRGFDRNVWVRAHEKPSKESVPVSHITTACSPAHSADNCGDDHGFIGCPGCRAEDKKHQVTDLVLVAHGVGQKLAERVESFHFTHAINGFRRAINVELANPVVQSVLREDHKGIMILPVNWRHTVSFEDGGLAVTSGNNQPSSAIDNFGLKDIEPTTIPAVRSVISDVMFDIPFYMSHHKPKMIQALVREANRVYRLWCCNNPGFAAKGRVHLIGHSLGSAMALEVLSKQPTVPPTLDMTKTQPEISFFEFDTKNLFLLGSPSAFFLLLEHGALVPRRGRHKPGVDPNDSVDDRVVGDAGTFGCLAVDNIYNILAKEDPIAYLLNGTIDTTYAASLKTAFVPSATVGFFASIGYSLRGVVPGTSAAPHPAAATLAKAPAATTVVQLPSQLELEVHDFTREEIAERKAFLLNDNGQIDYYLQSGGGPLEIQYLNMLRAHTSYWTNQDLIRMLCVEIGRCPGKNYALPSMRAVKATKRVIPNTI